MIVTSIEDYTKAKVKVSLDNRESFQLYKSEIKRYAVEEGIELDNYDEILSDILIPRAKKRTMHLLVKMDRTKADIRSKLKSNGYPIEAINEALAYVESYGYIDDVRYAYMYVRNYRDSRSINRIKQDLYRKGIEREIIDNAIEEEYTTDEEDIIRSLISKRKYDVERASSKERDKMYRFLLGKGFGFDMILSVIG